MLQCEGVKFGVWRTVHDFGCYLNYFLIHRFTMSHGNWKDMFRAVQQNDADLLEFYIRHGVDINYQHPEYFTSALAESIRLGHHAITKLLLERGASPGLQEVYSGKTPRQIAAELRNSVALELIDAALLR